MVLFIVIYYEAKPASAQVGRLACTAPVEVSAGGRGLNTRPRIAADAAGGLHVFWNSSEPSGGGTTAWVSYSHWNGRDWSLPLDVFYSGEGSFAVDGQGAADADGYLHSIWIDIRGLQYARRYVDDPVSAQSWKNKTAIVGGAGNAIGPADLAIDGDGNLHLVFWNLGANIPGVYYTRMLRGGRWEFPVLISSGNWPNVATGRQWYQAAVLAEGGTVHAAWAEPDNKIYHASGLQNGESWTSPREIRGGQQWVSLANLPNGALWLFSIGTPPGEEGICYKVQNSSPDGGNAWDDGRVILAPYIKGCLGRMTVLTDSEGKSNLVASAYRFEEAAENEKIWYSYWDRGVWQAPQSVAWNNFDYAALGDQPDFPTAAISLGNRLNIAFHVTEGRIWATQCTLPVAAVEPVAFPTPEPEEGDLLVIEEAPAGTPAAAITRPAGVSDDLEPLQSADPAYIGILLSATLIGAVILLRFFRRDGRER